MVLTEIFAGASTILLTSGIAGGAKWLINVGRRLDQQDEVLRRIEHETHTNTGSSLKDAVIRIEEKQANAKEQLDYQRGKLDALAAQAPRPVVAPTIVHPAPAPVPAHTP